MIVFLPPPPPPPPLLFAARRALVRRSGGGGRDRAAYYDPPPVCCCAASAIAAPGHTPPPEQDGKLSQGNLVCIQRLCRASERRGRGRRTWERQAGCRELALFPKWPPTPLWHRWRGGSQPASERFGSATDAAAGRLLSLTAFRALVLAFERVRAIWSRSSIWKSVHPRTRRADSSSACSTIWRANIHLCVGRPRRLPDRRVRFRHARDRLRCGIRLGYDNCVRTGAALPTLYLLSRGFPFAV